MVATTRQARRDRAAEHQPATAEQDEAASMIREMLKLAGGERRLDQRAVLDSLAIVLSRRIDGIQYFLVRGATRPEGAVALSPRELEIVRMVAKGHPNKIIADVLEISSWTVSTYLRRIFAKLGVGSRAAMIAKILNPAPSDEP
jgi:DNA-binding CsgD family transcriptional regulator